MHTLRRVRRASTSCSLLARKLASSCKQELLQGFSLEYCGLRSHHDPHVQSLQRLKRSLRDSRIALITERMSFLNLHRQLFCNIGTCMQYLEAGEQGGDRPARHGVLALAGGPGHDLRPDGCHGVEPAGHDIHVQIPGPDPAGHPMICDFSCWQSPSKPKRNSSWGEGVTHPQAWATLTGQATPPASGAAALDDCPGTGSETAGFPRHAGRAAWISWHLTGTRQNKGLGLGLRIMV